MIDLGSRALACKGWRWLPGMLTTFGERYELGDGPWLLGHTPDFTDPATMGCLLSLVRAAYAPAIWLTTGALLTAGGVYGWRVQGLTLALCPTEAAALVAALEAAP